MKQQSKYILLPIGILLVGMIYFVYQHFSRPNDKEDIVKYLKREIYIKQKDYTLLLKTIAEIKTIHNDWEIDNHPGQGIKFRMRSSLDTNLISRNNYIKKYYHGNSKNALINTIPDFEIPLNTSSLMNKLEIRTIWVVKNNSNTCIVLFYKNIFSPWHRNIFLLLSTNKFCSFKEIEYKEEDKYNWNENLYNFMKIISVSR